MRVTLNVSKAWGSRYPFEKFYVASNWIPGDYALGLGSTPERAKLSLRRAYVTNHLAGLRGDWVNVYLPDSSK